MERNKYHEVSGDEDLAFIAHQYGFGDWKVIEVHEKNKQLWEDGRTPHQLHKGDKVWIPELTPKTFDVTTNQRHRFVLPAPKMLLHTVIQDAEGLACGDVKYEVWAHGTRAIPRPGEEEARTRDDGLIHVLVPLAKEVELRVWFPRVEEAEEEDPDEGEGDAAPASEEEEEEAHEEAEEEDVHGQVADDDDPDAYETIVLRMGHLDPIDTVEGVQDRLNNLGYDCGSEHGEAGEATKAAVEEFQADHDLEPTGEIDDALRAALREVHDGIEADEAEGEGAQ